MPTCTSSTSTRPWRNKQKAMVFPEARSSSRTSPRCASEVEVPITSSRTVLSGPCRSRTCSLRKRSGGGLAVSTVGENLHADRQCFISYLDKYLSAAVERGVVSPEQKRIFIEQNERVTEAAQSPLSSEQLRELGERHGFDVEVVTDCYAVDTLGGPTPAYQPILSRKMLCGRA